VFSLVYILRRIGANLGENDTKRDETTTFNDDDELEHRCYSDGTQTNIIVVVYVVVVVTNRDDDERRTRTRETLKKTKSGDDDESE